MATLLLHDHTRCEVCGLPTYVAKGLHERRGWKTRRLTVDHIDPSKGSERENLRPLCRPCNGRRRDEQLTDEELLAWAQWYWPRKFNYSRRRLHWLNTHIDETGKAVGGTLFRSKRAEEIDRRIRGQKS